MARLLETDSLSNQDISSAVAIGAYTAAAVRLVSVRVLVAQAAGNGDYIIYGTLTKSATEYRIIPITTAAAANGVTALAFVSIEIPLDVDDVLTVYIDGLAGDNATPDTRVDFYEHDYLRPTTADRTLDVAATGEAGLDFTNRLDTTGILPAVAAGASGGLPLSKDASGRVEIAGATNNTLDALLTAVQGTDGDTLKTLSDQIDSVGAGAGLMRPVVSTDGQITLYQGYDYNSADNRAVEFTVASPDFTGATTALKFDSDSYAGSVVNPGLTTQLLRFEFTAVETAAMTAGHHAYRLEVTRAGRLLLEETGVINVKE
ncbi:MAG TPA: hypothetical protein PKW83_13735 [Verrucomicrobiota bacterium]|nr:hypothetical protein [Verrucomicrobiota bacterium]